MDDFETPNVIELMPLIHQVGGHSFMLSLDEATVCKALIPRELQFYQTLPGAVRRFIPAFHGVVRVRTIHDPDGYVRFLARPPPYYSIKAPPKARVRFKHTGSIELVSSDGIFLDEVTPTEGAGLNPWVLTCHKQHMDQWGLVEGGETQERDFIVLENLVGRFSCPCVLDLKMGTRQYGDAASQAKKQSKMVKVVSTTSAKLGLRVGGMQVYQTNTRRFLCRNKFFGRTLSVPGFQQALVQFLHNGVRFRSDVLSALVRKLEQLAAVLSKLDAIRFYTTSLLLLYEGLDSSESEPPEGEGFWRQNQEIVGQPARRGSDGDLARCPSAPLTSYDETPLASAQSKRRTSSAANLDSCTPSGPSSNSSSNSTIFEDTDARCNGRCEGARGRIFSTKSDPGGGFSGQSWTEPNVDVRMIDFAHSTHRDLEDPVLYAGPDRGFLFGLQTLIAMLKDIETDYG